MKHDALNEKLKDYDQWCTAAFHHARNKFFADVLTNFRRAGEAACKALLLERHHYNRAVELTGTKNFGDLIQTIIREGVADRQAIIWLQGLQTTGNPGAHDNQITQDKVDVGLATLRAFTNWLYGTKLGRPVPEELRLAMAPPDAAVPVVTRSELSINPIDTDLELNLRLLAASQDELRRATAQDKQEQQGIVDRLKEQVEEQKITAQEAREHVVEIRELLREKRTQPPIRWKWLLPAAGALIALVAALFFMMRAKEQLGTNLPIPIAAITVPPGGINVLVLPFAVLQDDPNVRINFEEALKGKMEQRIQSLGLPVKVIVGANASNRSFTVQEASAMAEREHASLVLYGELYEPTANDSGRVNINYVLSRMADLNTATMGSFSFRTLADSMSTKAQNAGLFMMDLALANKYARDLRFSDALMMLYDTRPITKAQSHTCTVFKAQCHMAVGDKVAALREAERCVAEDPTDNNAISFLGAALVDNGEMGRARDMYQKALDRDPNNPLCMIDLARVIGDASSPATLDLRKCERLVRASLELDTTNALAWQFMADIDRDAKRFDNARDHYLKSLAIAPLNAAAQVNLAEMFAFHYGKYAEAETLLSDVIQRDSSNTRALFMLANVFNNRNIKNEVAAYLFNKSKEQQPAAAAQALYGQGLVAAHKGDRLAAFNFLREAWKLDSSELQVGELFNQVARLIGELPIAKAVAERCLRLDPMAHQANFTMGVVLATSNNPNNTRALEFLERALRTDPHDVYLLSALATVSFSTGNFARSETVLRRVLAIEPRSMDAMGYLIQILRATDRPEEGLAWNEKALAVEPDNDLILCNQAVLLASIHPERIAEAITIAEHATNRNASAINLGTLCEVLIAAGQYQRAADVYRRALSTGEGWRDERLENDLANAGYPM